VAGGDTSLVEVFEVDGPNIKRCSDDAVPIFPYSFLGGYGTVMKDRNTGKDYVYICGGEDGVGSFIFDECWRYDCFSEVRNYS